MASIRNIIAAIGLIAVTLASSSALAQAQVQFSYQGRVKVSGNPFNGTGQFKFAILNTPGNTSLWSNDGTSAGGGEPTAFVSLPVDDGIFNVMMGDPATTGGMQTINPTILQSQTPLKLRVWFNGGAGFQQLNPDHKLVNLTLTTIETGIQDFTIYVNDATGNDANNGLTPATAKKTIQSAVDTLPDRIVCNVTIDIANGTYHEEVLVYGFAVKPGKTLLFQGEEGWTPSPLTEPAVKISGSDSDTTATRIRPTALHAVQCSGVSFTGIAFKFATTNGLFLENGFYTINKCSVISNAAAGLMADTQSRAEASYMYALDNGQTGAYLQNSSRVNFTHIQCLRNPQFGMRMLNQSNCSIYGSAVIENNGPGIQLRDLSMCSFAGGLSGGIQNNAGPAFQVVSGSMVLYSQVGFTFSNNIPGGLSQLTWGGQIFPVN